MPNVLGSLVDYHDGVVNFISSNVADDPDRPGQPLFEVKGYDALGVEKVGAVTVLFEIVSCEAVDVASSGDGGLDYELDLALHVVAPGRGRSSLVTLDLAFALAPMVYDQRWGFSGASVGRPSGISISPSMFQPGEHPYVASSISFSQCVTLGERFSDPVNLAGVLVHLDQLGDRSDPSEYKAVEIDVG